MTNNKISQTHKNRYPYNWLAYTTRDNILKKYDYLYKGTLYDFGAGEASYKNFFLSYADKYISVDWQNSLHSIKADIYSDLNEKLPIHDCSADTIVSLSVLEHLCKPQYMLYEAFRILKPRGYIVLQVPWQWLIHEAPYDYFRYTPYGLKYMLEKAGFVDVNIEPQNGFFTMLILKINYFSSRFVRGARPVRRLITTALVPFWYLGQCIAPLLDKVDRNWFLESSGYFVIAKKP